MTQGDDWEDYETYREQLAARELQEDRGLMSEHIAHVEIE